VRLINAALSGIHVVLGIGVVRESLGENNLVRKFTSDDERVLWAGVNDRRKH
jgi:hypothetical protein